ncbi:MAG: HNH endonuclease [Saprospiraceae bacterium]|jgi:hypothetical protein|nr:HNH endonuclease [Saprospiraceae bacterium]
MNRYFSDEIRQLVTIRASGLCEYCRMPDEFSFFSFHIDHIISIKHGGKSEPDNLAYSCPYCNRNKGTDIASILLPGNEVIRFFNPRIDNWPAHFQFENARIRPLTDIGKVTLLILGFNHTERIEERQILIDSGRHIFE